MASASRLAVAALLAIALPSAGVKAAAASSSFSRRQDAITAVPLNEVSSFKPYTHYASAAYCQPSNTLAWDCGTNCEANPSFVPIASGGDGTFTQFWFVGYDASLDEVIVSHQGTDVSKIVPALTDLTIVLLPPNPTMFPGMGLPIAIHSGFAATHASSAPDVLSAVQTAMSEFGTSKIAVTGHSLGAAIALLDAMFLPLHLPNATVCFVGYGLPRVGNQAFANYVDAQPVSITHINNKADPVPILPPITLGFHHPGGEIHIDSSEIWEDCPGQDNSNSECSRGSANLLFNNVADHSGPYDGLMMGC